MVVIGIPLCTVLSVPLNFVKNETKYVQFVKEENLLKESKIPQRKNKLLGSWFYANSPKENFNMSIEPSQLRDLIDDVLLFTLPEYHSQDAREILMMTAAQESHCGRYLKQVGCGVALGLFQIEPATYEDLFLNYLRYHKELINILESNFKVNKGNFRANLMGNLVYQIVIARLQYLRFPERLPYYKDKYEMACYYKTYWNTVKGKATIAEVLFNYDKYAF
jgi:hypothetical protein